MRPVDRWALLKAALCAAVGVAAAAAACCSLSWRMGIDTPVLMYLADRMVHHGAVPYRDFFDMNLPGSYWAYGLVARTLGATDLAVNLANVLATVAAGFLVYVAFGGRGRRFMLFGLSLSGLLIFSRGTEFVLQREVLALVPVAALAALSLRGQGQGRGLELRAGLVGCLLAMLALIKPQFVLYGALPVVLVWTDAGSRGRRLKVMALIGAGFAFPLAAVVAWLVSNGAWDAFLEVTRYWPLYGQMTRFHVFMDRPGRCLAVLDGLRLMVVSPFLAVACFSLWVAWLNRAVSKRELAMWAAWLLTAMAVPAVSGQFWAYHRLPFFWLTLCSTGYLLCGRQRWAAGTAVLLAAAWIVYAGKNVYRETAESSVMGQRQEVPDRFAKYLQAHLRPGDTVQPMDWAYGALYGMLQADAPLATRFPYTFYFHHHVHHPLIQKLRAEFLDELRQKPPRFLLDPFLVKLPSGVDTEPRFEAFEVWRNAHYRVVEEGAAYRIWERVPAGGAP